MTKLQLLGAVPELKSREGQTCWDVYKRQFPERVEVPSPTTIGQRVHVMTVGGTVFGKVAELLSDGQLQVVLDDGTSAAIPKWRVFPVLTVETSDEEGRS